VPHDPLGDLDRDAPAGEERRQRRAQRVEVGSPALRVDRNDASVPEVVAAGGEVGNLQENPRVRVGDLRSDAPKVAGQIGMDRDDVDSALCLPAAHRDLAAVEVHVAPRQPLELRSPKPRVERRRIERQSAALRRHVEEARDLVVGQGPALPPPIVDLVHPRDRGERVIAHSADLHRPAHEREAGGARLVERPRAPLLHLAPVFEDALDRRRRDLRQAPDVRDRRQHEELALDVADVMVDAAGQPHVVEVVVDVILEGLLVLDGEVLEPRVDHALFSERLVRVVLRADPLCRPLVRRPARLPATAALVVGVLDDPVRAVAQLEDARHDLLPLSGPPRARDRRGSRPVHRDFESEQRRELVEHRRRQSAATVDEFTEERLRAAEELREAIASQAAFGDGAADLVGEGEAGRHRRRSGSLLYIV
jgi:hypothetical protein